MLRSIVARRVAVLCYVFIAPRRVVVAPSYVFIETRHAVVALRYVFVAPCHAILHSNQTGSGAYTTWLMAPTYFPREGYVNTGTVRGAGPNGYWWSSTVDSATFALYLRLDPDVVNPENNNVRYYGFSLRCTTLRRVVLYHLQQKPNR